MYPTRHLTAAALLVGAVLMAPASAEARAGWKPELRTSLTHVRFLDDSRRFELEALVDARLPISDVKVALEATEEVIFDEELPTYEGAFEAYSQLRWTLKGRVVEGSEFPPRVTLAVDYRLPYDALQVEISELRDPAAQKASMRRLRRLKDQTITRLEALVLQAAPVAEEVR